MKVVNGKEFRDNIVLKLKERFKDLNDNQIINLEKGVYNYTIRSSDDKKIIKKLSGIIKL